MTIEMEYSNQLENLKLDYWNLLKELLNIAKPWVEENSYILNELKSHYSGSIKSVRTSDYITDLEGLLRILEKRDELSHTKIEPLVHINRSYVKDPGLARLLESHGKTIRQRPTLPLLNIYNLPTVWLQNHQPGNCDHRRLRIHEIRLPMNVYNATEAPFFLTLPRAVGIPSNRSPDENNAEIARIVLLEVSDKLGRYWRDVARFLGITENEIDEIDYQSHLPLKEKAVKALFKFQSKCNPSEWKFKLQQALVQARRRDLKEMVEELSSRKY